MEISNPPVSGIVDTVSVYSHQDLLNPRRVQRLSDTRGIEKAHPVQGKEILEKNQLRLSCPRQGPHGDRGLLRI